MEIIVLGSSSKGNCYFIKSSSSPLLIEAGIPFKDIQRKLEFKTSEIEGCLISHEHQDHAKAVNDLIKAGIDCYMSSGTAEALSISSHRVCIVETLKQFQIGEWTILPFDAVHDAKEPLNFLLAHNREKVVYITDTAYCKYRFNNLTHIFIEANYSLSMLNQKIAAGEAPFEMKKRLLRTHMSLETCKGFLLANDLNKVKEIWLLHLSDGNSNAEMFKREIQELTGKEVYIA